MATSVDVSEFNAGFLFLFLLALLEWLVLPKRRFEARRLEFVTFSTNDLLGGISKKALIKTAIADAAATGVVTRLYHRGNSATTSAAAAARISGRSKPRGCEKITRKKQQNIPFFFRHRSCWPRFSFYNCCTDSFFACLCVPKLLLSACMWECLCVLVRFL